ncbi:MAG: 2-hydroxyacyl-CoA dehydratase [Candidatus Lokiarchaeota archaeon]|nr:2-hydroxyacyl-CoA dehydratase [Candidatus Lokiarchaeota archaeon]
MERKIIQGNFLERPALYDVYENLIAAKEDGKKIVGIIPHTIVPDELIFSANAIPLHFCLGGTEDQMNTGHAYVAQTTCPFQRVNLGIFELRESITFQIYDLADLIITGTFCNGVQNTGLYLEKYFNKEQYPLIIPHTNKKTAFNYFIKELGAFKGFLEKKFQIKITEKKLNDSIKLYNELRQLYLEIDKFRYVNDPLISLSEIQNLIYNLYLNGPLTNLKELKKIRDKLAQNQIEKKNGIRIFLTGGGILLEDNFVSILENCNSIVIGDDLWTGFEFFSSMVDENSTDPLVALSERYINRNLTGRMIPDSYRIEILLKEYQKRKARGIINNYLKFCDSYSNSADFFKNKMHKIGIPVLNLERDYSQNSVGQLKTRIEAFLEILSS